MSATTGGAGAPRAKGGEKRFVARRKECARGWGASKSFLLEGEEAFFAPHFRSVQPEKSIKSLTLQRRIC